MANEKGFDGLGVGVDGVTPLEEFRALVQESESLGFHSFWLSEGYHSRSAVVRAALIAAATRKIKIGLGILSSHTKHPALLAMEAASIDEEARGRLILGVGRVRSALLKHGLAERDALRVVRESVEMVRALLGGRTVRYDGSSYKLAEPGSEIGFTLHRRDLPIYVGATGPLTLKLAGRSADGVLFNYPCTPSFIRYALPLIEDGLKRSGRTLKNFDIAAYLLVSVDENEKKALAAAAQFVAEKLPSRHPLMLEHAGVSREELAGVKESVERRGVAKAAAAIDRGLIAKVAIAGAPDRVADGIRRFAGTGLKLPIVWNIIGPDRRRSLDLIARRVMPQIL